MSKSTEPSEDLFITQNEQLWDARVPLHLQSARYPVEAFLGGKQLIDPLEDALLGDIKGRSVLHLQCHFGLTSLSIARRGAEITGLDFSQAAIDAATDISHRAGVPAQFIKGDARSFDLHRTFDVIFTSWGVLMWLPHLDSWAQSIRRHMHSSSRLILLDFHPFIWIWSRQFEKERYVPEHSYLNNRSPRTLINPASYTQDRPEEDLKQNIWIHPLSTVVSSLAGAGLHIETLQEYQAVPWRTFQFMEQHIWEDFWSLPGDPFPLSFAVTAIPKV